MTVNLPREEADRVEKQMKDAYNEGARDFEKTEREMEKHLEDEAGSEKEFDKGGKDTATDSKKIKKAESEVDKAPFKGELRKAASNLDKVSDKFKKASGEMKKDMKKGANETKKKKTRVRRAVPKVGR